MEYLSVVVNCAWNTGTWKLISDLSQLKIFSRASRPVNSVSRRSRSRSFQTCRMHPLLVRGSTVFFTLQGVHPTQLPSVLRGDRPLFLGLEPGQGISLLCFQPCARPRRSIASSIQIIHPGISSRNTSRLKASCPGHEAERVLKKRRLQL